MKETVLIILIIICFGCRNSVKESVGHPLEFQSVTLNSRQEYLRELFKKLYFRDCLNYGYNSTRKPDFLINDSSFENDFALGLDGTDMIDSLAKVQMEIIKLDSIKYFDELKEGDLNYSGRKSVFGICLESYLSEEIDSIATSWAIKISKR